MTTGQVSKRGAGFGAAHEACYLYAYADPGTGGDPWTCGIGHTGRAGPPAVKRGDRWPLKKCFDVYRNDIESNFAPGVRRSIKVQLEQHEFDAAVSFHLNTGAIGTGSVDDKLNAGRRAEALATWRSYNKAGGRVMQGLVNRRAEEIALFTTGRYPAKRILLRETPTAPARYINVDNIPWGDDAPPAVVELERPLPPPLPPVVAKPLPASRGPSLWQQVKGWLSYE
jgi:GH24 family phage-related lysozyme (muramidase)